ncbi:MAG: hypothetical protein RIA08_00780 [Roseovarius sp.]|uniref:hypothetical protein n=1 Tax=Roseovarius sp. TaxID=1486281 RepID=UPI0032ECA37C
MGEVICEARAQGREEPLIRPYGRLRVAGAGDFPGQQVADELTHGDVSPCGQRIGRAVQVVVQENLDPGFAHPPIRHRFDEICVNLRRPAKDLVLGRV